MTKHCPICGKEFKSPPSSKKVTCSKECSSINKSNTHQGKRNKWSDESRQRVSALGMTDNLRKGTPAAQGSPIAGPFETNRNAKEWRLMAPDGTIYEVLNLALWLRNNAHFIIGITIGNNNIIVFAFHLQRHCISSYLV